MPSFIDSPKGCDKSIINRLVPSFFSRDPRGEQCRLRSGGSEYGPAVCFRESSLQMAAVTASEFSVAERRFLGNVVKWGPA